MENYKIEQKAAFRVIGFKTALTEGTSIHSPQYSPQKTAFFKNVVESGRMAVLRPLAESPYGFAAIAKDDAAVYYYAGVQSLKPLPAGTEEVGFPEGRYLILSGRGGLSRLAFDKLEEQAFGSILTGGYEWEYCGAPIAEVLLNGNPADAEVEVWVPVRKREAR